jgi:hypothetical protein
MQREVIIPSTSTRKRRFKSSLRYSTMKELQNVGEYKRLLKKESNDPSNVTKASKLSKKLLKMSETILESDE